MPPFAFEDSTNKLHCPFFVFFYRYLHGALGFFQKGFGFLPREM